MRQQGFYLKTTFPTPYTGLKEWTMSYAIKLDRNKDNQAVLSPDFYSRVTADGALQMKLGSVTGPVGMAGLVNKTAHTGTLSYLYLVALISLNMAIINLLPFPALDGGRIIFVLIRKITGNMISTKVEGYMHLAGFAILMALFVLITWQDLSKVLGH